MIPTILSLRLLLRKIHLPRQREAENSLHQKHIITKTTVMFYGNINFISLLPCADDMHYP